MPTTPHSPIFLRLSVTTASPLQDPEPGTGPQRLIASLPPPHLLRPVLAAQKHASPATNGQTLHRHGTMPVITETDTPNTPLLLCHLPSPISPASPRLRRLTPTLQDPNAPALVLSSGPLQGLLPGPREDGCAIPVDMRVPLEGQGQTILPPQTRQQSEPPRPPPPAHRNRVAIVVRHPSHSPDA